MSGCAFVNKHVRKSSMGQKGVRNGRTEKKRRVGMKDGNRGRKKNGGMILYAAILFSLSVQPCFGAEDPTQFPSKPITMIVPWTAGGVVDLSGRELAGLAGKVLGQPVVVENKPGGGAVIGTNATAKANPDGYTIGAFSDSPAVTVPHLRAVPYNPITDFTFIMQYCTTTQIFCVKADSPWKTFKDFVTEARKKPAKLNYTSPGPFTGQHIFMEQLFLAEKVKLNHIPVGGGKEATIQLLGGHVDGALTPDFIPHIKTGKVRGLLTQSEKRIEWVPDILTFGDLGYNVQSVSWVGLCAPKGLHPAILKKLSDAFQKAYEGSSFRALMASLYLPLVYKDSEAFQKMVIRDFEDRGRVLKELGFVK